MGVCSCSLAGTNACLSCPNNGTYNDGFGNKFKIIQTEISYPEVSVVDYEQELKECVLDLCNKCQSQKIFTSEWCKECKWNDYKD